MVGKKNVVFGLLFLVLTAGLGPYMIVTQLGSVAQAQADKQQAVGRLQLLADSGFEDPETLAPMSAEAIARENAHAVLALNKVFNARAPVDAVKGGPHAHGNLEALLNIAVGVVLCFVAAPMLLKQAVSWLFILGTLLHAGLLYLAVFNVAWAGMLLGYGAGPIMLLGGLLLAGLIALTGWRGEPVRDL